MISTKKDVLESDRYIYVDVETTGLDARKDRVRIVAIDGVAYDIWNYDTAEKVEDILGTASAGGKTFVAHNAQFDLDFLASTFPILDPWRGPIYDTMVAYQLVMAGRRIKKKASPMTKAKTGKDFVEVSMPASLDAVAKTTLGISVDKSFQKSNWAGNVDNQMLEYAAKDTSILPGIVAALDYAMLDANLTGIFRLEMALLPVLLSSRRKGITLDVRGAEKLISSLSEEAGEMESRLPYIDEEVPAGDSGGLFDDSTFIQVPRRRLNPRAPGDITRYFDLPDATEDTMREYVRETGDKEAQTIRNIKKKYKKASTLRKQLLNRVGPDGRIHPWFNQTFVETGRLSSREPNLQNQDRGSDVRGLFVPARNSRFVISDYSQLELRLAAYFSRDEAMLTAYRSGRDLHTETQLNIFGDPKHKSKDQAKRDRTLSKNINFGLIYGGGHGVLIRFAAKSDIYLTEEEAVTYRNAFRDLYPELVRWQERTGNTKPEYVRTYRGRRRYITPGEGFCTRINNIVQGSAADGMKLAMVELHRAGIQILLNVHDEVVIECPTSKAESVLTTVQTVMVDAMYRAVGMDAKHPVVPIEVEAAIADSWAEK